MHRTSSSSITAPLEKLGCGHDLLAVFWHKVRILWRKSIGVSTKVLSKLHLALREGNDMHDTH